MSTLIDYYNENADQYVEKTNGIEEVDCLREMFRRQLERHVEVETPMVLDLGSAYGRDSNAFIQKYQWDVDSRDGSHRMAELADKMFGIDVKVENFLELDEYEKYDGIWAMSSILHLERCDLPIMFHKMFKALKQSGVIYTSFINDPSWIMAYDHEGRRFLCFTPERLRDFVHSVFPNTYKKYTLDTFTSGHRDEKKGWVSMVMRVEK